MKFMLVERKKTRRKEKKNLPGAQTTSDVVWARLLHEVAVVARSVGGVWMGVEVGGSGGVEVD
jgi:hypothetical protein